MSIERQTQGLSQVKTVIRTLRTSEPKNVGGIKVNKGDGIKEFRPNITNGFILKSY